MMLRRLLAQLGQVLVIGRVLVLGQELGQVLAQGQEQVQVPVYGMAQELGLARGVSEKRELLHEASWGSA